MVPRMFAGVRKVSGRNDFDSLHVVCNYFIAPVGEHVFAVLGEDRVLYVPLDSELGKEFALRIVRKTGWNIKRVKVGKSKRSAVYGIPKNFAQRLDLRKGDYVLVIGNENKLEIIPMKTVVEKIGTFKEPKL